MKQLIFTLFIFLFSTHTLFAQQADSSNAIQYSNTNSILVVEKHAFITDLKLHPLLIDKKTPSLGLAKNRQDDNKTGTFFLALGFLFMLSFLKNGFPSHFNNLFSIFTTFGTSKRHMKEQLENDSRASIGFYILYIVSLSFVVFTALKYFIQFPFQLPSIILFLYSLATIFILLGFKSLFIKLLAWVFQKQDAEKKYSSNNSIVNEFAGMILFPICILMLLLKGKALYFLILLSGIILAILLLYKYLKNMSLLNNLMRMNFIHFLLYLCAFELLPALVIVKIIIAQ